MATADVAAETRTRFAPGNQVPPHAFGVPKPGIARGWDLASYRRTQFTPLSPRMHVVRAPTVQRRMRLAVCSRAAQAVFVRTPAPHVVRAPPPGRGCGSRSTAQHRKRLTPYNPAPHAVRAPQSAIACSSRLVAGCRTQHAPRSRPSQTFRAMQSPIALDSSPVVADCTRFVRLPLPPLPPLI